MSVASYSTFSNFDFLTGSFFCPLILESVETLPSQDKLVTGAIPRSGSGEWFAYLDVASEAMHLPSKSQPVFIVGPTLDSEVYRVYVFI